MSRDTYLDLTKLVHASYMSENNGIYEFELEDKAPELVTAHGEIVFVCASGGNLVVCIGKVQKYKEMPGFTFLSIKGRMVSISC